MLDRKTMKIMFAVLLIISIICLTFSFILDTNLILKIANVIVITTALKNLKELKEFKSTQ